jgi:hypothetical protein
MKQVASRAIHLIKAQIYIGKWEGAARQLICSHWLAHNEVNQWECETSPQFPLVLSQLSEPIGDMTRITSIGPLKGR